MESKSPKALDERVSFLQVFAILLVVIGHSFYRHEENPVFEWIYSFHMPLFFFISGCLLNNSVLRSGKPLGEYFTAKRLLQKAKRLLLPYWLISSLVFLPKSLLGGFAGRPVDLSLSGYAYMMQHPLENVISIFWFLPTLFLVFCIAFVGGKLALWNRSRYANEAAVLVTLPLVFYFPRYSTEFLNYPGVLAFVFYFALGYWFRGQSLFSVWNSGTGFRWQSAFAAVACMSFYALSPDWQSPFFAVAGIVMSLGLADIYCCSGVRFFRPFYGSTYTIYLFSWFFQVASQQVFLSVTGLPWGYGSALAMVSGFLGPFAIFKGYGALSTKWRSRRA